MKKAPVLLNAMHTSGGGGVSYLAGILPHLVRDKRFAWTLLAPAATIDKITVPAGVKVWHAPQKSFAASHVWEQVVLPFKAYKRGFKAILCNANYVPLLGRKPLPVIHTTPLASAQARSLGMRIYWVVLRVLTVLSLLRAPRVFSVAAHVIPHYLPLGRSKVRVAPPAVAGKPVKARKDENLLVAVGDFYPHKNYALMIKAMSLLVAENPALRLEIIGRPVDAACVAEVEVLLKALGLEEHVQLVGALPHDILMKRLAGAAVFVSTSLAECFNMPVLEAMHAGTAVVCADFPFQREVAKTAAVYVPMKGNERAAVFATAVARVLKDKPARKRLEQAGRARAAQFSWSATAAVIAQDMAKVVRA